MTEEARPVLVDYLSKHYGSLKLRVSRLLRDSELASDALHDAWLRLKTKETEAPIQSPGSYLVRMVVNVAVDIRRRQGRAVPIEEIKELMTLSDAASGPSQAVESRSELDTLIGLVERMPERRREIFILVHWEGVVQDEVAKRMGCSKRTVEYELKHAHDYLLARMKR